MKTDRQRQCPACRATFPAGGLWPLRGGLRRGPLRRCPVCGHTAFASHFPLVEGKPITYAGLN